MAQRTSAWMVVALLGLGCGGGSGTESDGDDGEAVDAAAEDSAAETDAAPDVVEDAGAEAEVEASEDVLEDGVADGDAGAGPSLVVTYADPCPCIPAPCCPTVTLSFQPGDAAAWFLMCGDAVECVPPPVGWERRTTDGSWERVVSPGVSASAGFQCAPESFTDPWFFSVPMPPSGTVRAVGLFDDECGADPGTCATRCDAPYEVISNSIEVP